jgi:hypothetical protein
MADTSTYTLLQRISLTSSASSVTFSNIPQSGYTDLKIVASTRYSGGGYGTDMTIAFNGSTSSFTGRRIYGYGGGVYSDTQTNVSGVVVGAGATANTFSSNEIYIPNYLSSNYKSYSIDGASENNNSTSYLLELSANLWSNTAAISSVTLGVGSGTFDTNSTFSLYAVSAVGTTPGTPKATGGDIIRNDGTYWYHAFLNTGQFTPGSTLSCDVLQIAGGGGGGGGIGAGGGAGGLLSYTSQSLTATNYPVVIGAGGAYGIGSTYRGISGSNSQFSTLTASIGGGGGGSRDSSQQTGGTGGSGGGGTNFAAGGSGTSGQGNAGGTPNSNAPGYPGAGGGGAGAAGGNGDNNTGGNGGNGSSAYSSWGAATLTGENVSSTYYYAGGGGGAVNDGLNGGGTAGIGGYGGGGYAAPSRSFNASPGSAGTGGGGGGNGNGSGFTGGNGGSGIIIIRYPV